MTDDAQFELIESINTPLGAVKISVTSNGSATIATGEMPKIIGNGMSIEHSQVALITVIPDSDLLSIKITCELVGSDYQGTSSTGQYLDCIEWFTDEWHMTIGTEDTESLKIRFPELNIVEAPYPIEYHDSGMTMDLTVLNAQTEMTLHMIISSKSLPDERGCTAWYFADMPHDLVTKVVN